MTRVVSNDFEHFAEGLPRLHGRYILRTAQSREWRLRVVDLNGVTLMAGREGAGRVYTGVAQDFHVFLLLSGCESMTKDGEPFDRSQIACVAPGTVFHSVTDRPIRWLNFAVSADCLSEWARTHEDFDPDLLRHSQTKKRTRFAVALLRLARRLLHVDARSPALLQAPCARRVAREELLTCLFRALRTVDARAGRTPRPQAHRLEVLQKALRLMESLDTEALYIQDFCAAAGASERTLRNVFNEYFGMSPHHYLIAHRLHSIRSAIRRAGPAETVTSICSRFGAWDFGRLAKQYKDRFGELPSQTLHARQLRPALAAGTLTSARHSLAQALR